MRISAMTETPEGQRASLPATTSLACFPAARRPYWILRLPTVRRMASAGQIPALRTGKDYRYSWNAVLDVLRQPHPIAGGSGNEESRPGAGRLATQQARDRAAREL